MRKVKKEEMIVFMVVLLGVVAFTLVNDPTITGNVAVYRIYGFGNFSGEDGGPVEGNSPPIIYFYKPTAPVLNIGTEGEQSFVIEKADPDNDEMSVKWYLNSFLVKEDSDYYVFSGGDYDLGRYNLTVVVSDGSLSDKREWVFKLEEGGVVEEDYCGECCGVVCAPSEVECPDGYIATCANQCDVRNGRCSTCEPTCTLYPAASYISGNYQTIRRDGLSGISRRTVPCINVTSEKKRVAINEVDIEQFANMPEGYSMILSPFNLDCEGGEVELTLSLPNDFKDIQALRCSGVDCYPNVVERTRNLECGGRIVKEFVEKSEYFDPKLSQVEIEEISLDFGSYKQALRTGDNKIWFHGEVFDELSATLSAPDEIVEQIENPNLKILNVLNVKIEGGEGAGTVLEMPYVQDDKIDEASVGIYVKLNESWELVGGKVGGGVVKVAVEDINQYLSSDGEAVFATMGAICVNCVNSSFEMVYEPNVKSREAVLLVHGFTSTPLTYSEMIDDFILTEQPYQLWVYGYPSTRKLDLSITELADFLEANSAKFDKLTIVAHSLGGLVVQQALYLSEQNPNEYSYLDKVKKLVLIGVPNEGAPGIQNQKEIFNYIANLRTKNFFDSENILFDTLAEGIVTPKIEGINYYVVAGVKPISVSLPFFKTDTGEVFEIYEKNDGIVTVSSAQRVGDEYINDMCNNYWEINLSHIEQIHEKEGRELVEKILSEELLSRDEQTSLLGNNQYFKLKIADCSAEDQYVVMGKKIPAQEVEDPTGCSCGNGFCGVGEDEFSCPSDCEVNIVKSSIPILPYVLGVLILIFSVYRHGRIQRLKHIGVRKLLILIKGNYDISVVEGISSIELKRELSEKGISHRFFDDAIKVIYNDFLKKYISLEDDVESRISKGASKEKVVKEFMKDGWSSGIIEKAIDKEVIHIKFRKKVVRDVVVKSKGKYFGVSS